MTVVFENGKVIANGEAGSSIINKVVSEAIAPVSVEVNEESVAVTFDRIVSLLNFQ